MQITRRLSQVMGLSNESTAPYTSASWDPELYHDALSDVSLEVADAPVAGEEDVAAAPPRMAMGKRISTFFGIDSGAREADVDAEREEKQLPSTSGSKEELVSRVKNKVSVFLAMTRPHESAESSTPPPESSDAAQREIDLPTTFHRSSGRRQHPRLKQGPGKSSSTPWKRSAPIQSQHQVHMLSTLQLISITFFAVSGGPYGFEPTVGAGGPGLMLVGLLLVPVLWAAPLAFMTAELSCMIPESGGHVLWVYRAFGPFWSFVNSCFAFACSILDNAMYPVLFVEYLSALLYEGKDIISYGWSVFIKIFLVFIVTVINILGINIVGVVSVILGILVLAPFITMCLIGLTHLNFDWMGLDGPDTALAPSPSLPTVIDWGKFLTLLLWNTSGFDAAGTCAAEVRNPGHSFPRALSISVMLMVGVYALPTIIGVSVLPDYRLWKEGTYIIVAKLIGGDILKVVLRAGWDFLQLQVRSDSSLPVFVRIPESSMAWPSLSSYPCNVFLYAFDDRVQFLLSCRDMLFYAFSTVLKFSALVQLRFTEPDAFRPYRIPLSDYALGAAIILPIGSCIAMLAFSSERAHGIGLAGASCAVLLFTIKELYYQYGTQAEEAVQDRMSRVQQNLDSMQKRIDKVIEEEFTAPVRTLGGTLGDAIRQSPQQISQGLRVPVKSLSQGFSYPVKSLGIALRQAEKKISLSTRSA
ncbi:hypothetical protein AXG93_4876s1010 [Marchantia polymorpha subsp. ruderalis]|uniref:Amino acid permease/ SLC12A domain-containing protein n=1 Tax=Marchantia polymorpha subsp. ruderalis TaxID=1480154 RepID=A0A176WC49_MARPO|nr:hypothetical protein AXG93_4876s1010 [Marchantia polymorpha subsp. ruderalis]